MVPLTAMRAGLGECRYLGQLLEGDSGLQYLQSGVRLLQREAEALVWYSPPIKLTLVVSNYCEGHKN